MAWNDLMIRVGMDSRGFSSGVATVKRDSKGLRDGMLALSRTINDQKARLRELGHAGKGASTEYKTLKAEITANRSQLNGLSRELRATEAAMGKAGKGAGVFKGAMSSLTGGLIGGGIGAAATMGAAKVAQTFTETLNVAVSFDDAMRRVAATSGATGEGFERLRQAAIDMGSATRFTASQAGDALNYMALAGWSVDQSIAGLPGVLSLAAAAGTDLAMTSDILTDTMAAFSMQAKEAGYAADIFAQIQSRTNTTVEMLGEAMKYAAPQAASAGQSLKDTATVLGLLADQGIKGSMAGTAFNAMLKDLKTQSDNGVLSFGKLNIALYNSDGSFRNLLDIIRDMRKGVEGLTQQQRDAVTGGIFEERSIKAINILLNTSEQKINSLADAMNNASGRAAAMEKMMEGGVGGALRRMQSAWEGLQLTVSQDAGIAQTWYSFWSERFSMWTVQLKGVIGWWDRLTGNIKRDMPALRKAASEAFNIVAPATGPAAPGSALPKQATTEDPVTGTMKKTAATTRTAATEYRDLQKELSTTKEWLAFVGKENEYIATASELVAQKMEAIFMMGGQGAVKYAGILKGELQSLLAESRQQDMVPVPEIGMRQPGPSPSLPSGMVAQIEIAKTLRGEMFMISQQMEAFGDVFDGLGAKISSTTNAINESLQSGMAANSAYVQALVADLRLLQEQQLLQMQQEQMGEEAKARRMTLTQDLTNALGNMMQDIGSNSDDAAGAMRRFGLAALESAQKAVQGAIAAAAAEQIKTSSKLGPIGIAVAGASIAALFGLIKGALSQTKGLKLAKGGLAYGETLATVGDNPGARFDPEVVAPLSKLEGMLKTTNHLTGQFTVSGTDLVLVLDNAQRKMSAFRK